MAGPVSILARSRVLPFLRSDGLILGLSAVWFAACWPFTQGLAEPGNLQSLLAALLPLFVAALGQTLVLIGGGIDLSLTSTIALTSVAGAAVMNSENGWLMGRPEAVFAGIGLMLAIGAAIGALNGFAVTRLRMPPFMVTLTTMMFFSGLAVWATQSKNINGLPESFNALGGTIGPLLLISALAGIAVHLLLNRTLLGRWLYAAGHNPRAALTSGVPTAAVITGSYVLSGLCAAIASVLYTGQTETGSPVLGQRLLLDIVGATVIGGTSLFGGKGKVLWTLSGALLLKLIDNTLGLLGFSHFSILMVKGAVILSAAVADAWRARMAS